MSSQTNPLPDDPSLEQDSSKRKPKREIRQRSFDFAVRSVKLCKYLERNTSVSKSLISQLLRASTSIGANLEEAAAGESRADFIHKSAISLKESRETRYWLRIIASTEVFDEAVAKGLKELQKEAEEISRVIGKIVANSRKNGRGQ